MLMRKFSKNLFSLGLAIFFQATSAFAQNTSLGQALDAGISGMINQPGYGSYDVTIQEADGVIRATYESLGCEALYTPIRVKSPNHIVYRAHISVGDCVGGNITLSGGFSSVRYEFRFPGEYNVIASGRLSRTPEPEPPAPEPPTEPIVTTQAPQPQPAPESRPVSELPVLPPEISDDTKAEYAEQPPEQVQIVEAGSIGGDASLIGQSVISQDYVPGEVLAGNYRLGHRIYLPDADFTRQNCDSGLPITVRISTLLPLGHLDDLAYTGPFFYPTLRDLDWHCQNEANTRLKSVSARYEFRGETVATLRLVATQRENRNGQMRDVFDPAGFEVLVEPAPFPETVPDHIYDKAFKYMMVCPYSSTCEVDLTFRELEQLAQRGDPQAAYFLAHPDADQFYRGRIEPDTQIFEDGRRDSLELSTVSVEAYGDEDRLRRAADLGSLFANYGLARQIADEADLIDFDGYMTGRAPSGDLALLSDEDRHDFIVWFAKARYGGWLDAQKFEDFDALFTNWGIDITPVLSQIEQTGILVPNSDISTDYAYSDALTKGVVRSVLNALLIDECQTQGQLRQAYNDALLNTGQALSAEGDKTLAGQVGPLLTLSGAIGGLTRIEPRGPFCFFESAVSGIAGFEIGFTVNRIDALECNDGSDEQTCTVTYSIRCVEHTWQQGTVLPDIDLICPIIALSKTQTTEFTATHLGAGRWSIEGVRFFKNGISP